MKNLMLDACSHGDGERVALTIQAEEGGLGAELRLDVELEDAERFHRELGEAIERTRVNKKEA